MGTVSTNIFLAEESSETCLEEFKNHFLDPYLAGMKANMDPSLSRHINFNMLRLAAVDQVKRTS